MPGVAGSKGSPFNVMPGANSFSPRRVPPPFLEKKLRPSSARRRVERVDEEGEHLGDARRIEHDLPRPGLGGRGFATERPCRPPRRPAPTHRARTRPPRSAPAQPDPVPSGLRAVMVRLASVDEWEATSPAVVASADVAPSRVVEAGRDDPFGVRRGDDLFGGLGAHVRRRARTSPRRTRPPAYASSAPRARPSTPDPPEPATPSSTARFTRSASAAASRRLWLAVA